MCSGERDDALRLVSSGGEPWDGIFSKVTFGATYRPLWPVRPPNPPPSPFLVLLRPLVRLLFLFCLLDRASLSGMLGEGVRRFMSTTIFETPRLLGRPLVTEDIDALHAVYGDVDAMRWVGDGKPLDRAQCAHWVEVTHRNYATRGYGMFALVLRETGDVIGFCGLVHPGGQPEAEIKYALLRTYWDQGLATEAVRAMLGCGAQTFGLSRIIATIYPDNTASQRVLMKAGMAAAEQRNNEDGSVTDVYAWEPDA